MTRSTALSAIRPIPRRGLSSVEAAMYIGISASKFAAVRAVVRFVPCGAAPVVVGRTPKKAVEGAVNMIRSHIRPGISEVELIEMPILRTTRFDEDAREHEITIKGPPKRAEAAV